MTERPSQRLLFRIVWVTTTMLFSLAVVALVQRALLLDAQLAVAGVAFVVVLLARPYLALAVAAFSIPFADFLAVGPVGTIGRVAGIVLAASYAYNVIRGHVRWRPNALTIFGWLWLLWAFASLAWSERPQPGDLFTLVQLMLLAFITASLIADRPRALVTTLWAYSIGAGAIATQALVRVIRGLDVVDTERLSAGAQQAAPHFAALLVPALLFILLQGLMVRRSWVMRAAALAVSALLALGILFSGTRSAWVGVLSALALLIVPRLRRLQFVLLVALAAVGVGIVVATPQASRLVIERTSTALETGGAGRVGIWQVGTGIFLHHPVLGTGFRNFSEAFDLNSIRRSPVPPRNLGIGTGFGPHNIYLGTAAELGLVGLALLLAWLGTILRHLRPRDLAFLAVSAAFIAFLVQGAFLDILNRKYFWLLLGLAEASRLVGLERRVGDDGERSTARAVGDPELPAPG